MASDNVSLGELGLLGLAPAPRGAPKIDVTFDVDANGILEVTAKDAATGKSQSIQITGGARLPNAERDRMVQEAERYAEQDRKRRDDAEKLNAAEATTYQAEKTLADFGDRMSADVRGRIEAGLKETREAHARRDAALAEQRAESLRKVLQEAGAALYAQATKTEPEPRPNVSSPGEPRPSGEGPRGRVVDAEFKETPR
jgi:molecular chaperone DnaK